MSLTHRRESDVSPSSTFMQDKLYALTHLKAVKSPYKVTEYRNPGRVAASL